MVLSPKKMIIKKGLNNKIIINITSLLVFSAFFLLDCKRIVAEETKIIPQMSARLLIKANQAYFSGNYEQAIKDWNLVIKSKNLEPKIYASVYENVASLQQYLGFPGKAIQSWQESVKIYQKENENKVSQLHLAAVIIDQSQAYNDLGQPRFSIPLVQKAVSIIDRNALSRNSQLDVENSTTKSIHNSVTAQTSQVLSLAKLKQMAFLTLGNAYTIKANYDKAIEAYQRSLNIESVQKIDSNLAKAIYTSLSQTYQQKSITVRQKAISAELEEDLVAASLQQQADRNHDLAIAAAQTATRIEPDSNSIEQAQALIQLARLVKKERLLSKAETITLSLPDSYQKVYTLLNLASEHNPQTLLPLSVDVSKNTGNLRVSSFALGALGKYYEQHQQYNEALLWTEKALSAAKKAEAPDSLYQWNWQAGRIFKAKGQKEQSVDQYENAIASLQLIRREYAQAQSEQKIDFQTKVEPVYRQYLGLLLAGNPSFSNLQRALEVRQLLQLSELENFFKDDCLTIESSTPAESKKSQKATNTSIVTTIILPDRTHVIWQLSNGSFKHYSINISKIDLRNLLKQWRFDLENYENDNYLSTSQQLYSLLFSPIEKELKQTKTRNLVFVNDGMLRNLPMAALHDGKSYLVNNYAITNSLGLGLKIESERKSQIPQQALLFGLSKGNENFSSLPFVVKEIEEISKIITNNQEFLDREFSQNSFDKETSKRKSSVVHIATHGKFAGTIEESFLRSWNGKIGLRELENVLIQRNSNFDNKIQLLALSACDTAQGNERATLGMSGVALRSGVENTLGSLWSVDDRQTSLLVERFYHNWIEGQLSLGEALRQAQLKAIQSDFQHPSTWSEFILFQS